MIKYNHLIKTLLYLFVFSVPLEISKLWFPFLPLEKPIDGHPVSLMDLSRLFLILLVFSVLLGSLLRSKKIKLPHAVNRKFWVIYLLLALYLVSLTYTPALSEALKEVVRLIFQLFVALVIVWTVNDERDIHLVFSAFRAIILLLGLIVLFQAVTGIFLWHQGLAPDRRFNATMADPNMLARYMVIGFFAWLLYKPGKGLWSRALRFMALGLSLLAVLLSQSRAAWLVFTVMTFWVLFLHSPRSQRTQTRIWLVSGVLFAMVVVSLSGVLQSKINTFQYGIAALGARVNLIRGGLAMFMDHPLIGVGLRGYPVVYIRDYPQYLTYYGIRENESHTYLVNMAAEFGVIGLVILFWFMFQSYNISRMLHKGWREMESFVIVAFSGILIIFACSQAEGSFWEDPYLWVFFGSLVAILKLYILRRANSQEARPAMSRPRQNTLQGKE